MFIGVIQAFIFALLTVLYFAMAGAGHDEHEDHEEQSTTQEKTTDRRGRDAEAPAPRTEPGYGTDRGTPSADADAKTEGENPWQ